MCTEQFKWNLKFILCSEQRCVYTFFPWDNIPLSVYQARRNRHFPTPQMFWLPELNNKTVSHKPLLICRNRFQNRRSWRDADQLWIALVNLGDFCCKYWEENWIQTDHIQESNTWTFHLFLPVSLNFFYILNIMFTLFSASPDLLCLAFFFIWKSFCEDLSSPMISYLYFFFTCVFDLSSSFTHLTPILPTQHTRTTPAKFCFFLKYYVINVI